MTVKQNDLQKHERNGFTAIFIAALLMPAFSILVGSTALYGLCWSLALMGLWLIQNACMHESEH